MLLDNLYIYNKAKNYINSENKDIDLLMINLIKCNIELQYDDFSSAKKSFDAIMKCSFSNLKFIKLILKLAINLNCLNSFNNKFKNMSLDEINNIPVDSFEGLLTKNYLQHIKLGKNFDFDSLIKKAKDNKENISILFFIIYTFEESSKIKKEALINSYTYNNNNLSAVSCLLKQHKKLTIYDIKNLLSTNINYIFNEKFYNSKEKKLDFSFLPLGGGDEIGASSYFMKLGKANILIDFGIKFSKDFNQYPNFDALDEICPIKDLSLVILTHAHLDHCGAILKLLEKHNNLKILMSKETLELMKLNIRSLEKIDNYKIEQILKKCISIDFNMPLNFNMLDLTIEFFRAGHILGATSILFKNNDCTVFFTGDYSIDNQITVPGITIPKDCPIDILITENTYGDRLLGSKPSKKIEYNKLINYVTNKINEGKKILIPSFAIGRAQELISILHQTAIDNKFRLYIDGLAAQVNEIYEKHTNFKLHGRNIYYVKNNIYDNRTSFIKEEFMNTRSCVITSSGMLQEGSASIEYAKEILQSDKGACILTGYQSHDTLGAQLKNQLYLNCNKYFTIDNETFRIHAELTEFNLSAHCNIEDILATVYKLAPKRVILIHGNAKDKETELFKILNKIDNIKVYQSKNNELIKF